jgi:PAS domain-containing protein
MSEQDKTREHLLDKVRALRERLVELERAEAAHARLAAVIDETTDFVGMAALDGRVVYINRAGRRMLGIPEGEDLSRTTVADYHAAWAADLVRDEGIPTALRVGSWSAETALRTRDGRDIPPAGRRHAADRLGGPAGRLHRLL